MENTERQQAMVVRQNETFNELAITLEKDLSHLSLEERAHLFERITEAQAGEQIEEKYMNKEMTVTGLTVFQRPFQNQDSGFFETATYVSFEFENGESIRTASSQAVPFALTTAKLIGYDAVNGKLPHPIKIMIKSQKAPQGFIYRFLFKGLAKASK